MILEKEKYKKINKVLLIPLALVLICVLFLGYFAFLKFTKTEVYLKENLNVEINTEVYTESFIKKIKNAKLLSENKLIDTSSLGEQKITIHLKKTFNEEEYSFKINVVDTTSPVIECDDKISTYVSKEIDLSSLIKVSDNSNETLIPLISGEYDINKKGEYKLMIEVKDSSDNKTTKELTLNIETDPNNYTFTTSKGFKGEVKNGITYIEGTLIANKTYSLPSSYGSGLTKETNNAFNEMVKAAKKEGYNIYITSGFRSYDKQNTIYNNYVKEDGKKEADTYSARPGHSEHQTGLAIDINQIKESFGNTEEGIWISNNCYKYGFILRYPKGKQEITGYIYEPWHLRYVGVELASKLYNNGNWITLEEYFGIDSKYKD